MIALLAVALLHYSSYKTLISMYDIDAVVRTEMDTRCTLELHTWASSLFREIREHISSSGMSVVGVDNLLMCCI